MTPNYIFIDIDMTLWDEHWIIPESTKAALAAAVSRGNKIFINTGRSRSNVHENGIEDLPWSGYVCACGGHIEMDGEILREVLIPYDILMKALNTFKDHGMPAVVEGRDLHFINLDDFPGDTYVHSLWDKLGQYVKPLSEMTANDAINKYSANISSQKDLAECYDLLKDDLDFIDHNNSVVEVIPKGLSKANGIQWLMDRFGIPAENIYAIGDGMNDYEMISFARHGIAMGNAVEEIKGIAEYVTDDIHSDGLYKAFEHYGLI